MSNEPGLFVKGSQAIFTVFFLMGMLYAVCAIGIISHKYVLGIYDLEQRVQALENKEKT